MVDTGSSAKSTFVDVLAVVAVREDHDGRMRGWVCEDEVLPTSVVAPLPEIALSIHLFDADAVPSPHESALFKCETGVCIAVRIAGDRLIVAFCGSTSAERNRA